MVGTVFTRSHDNAVVGYANVVSSSYFVTLNLDPSIGRTINIYQHERSGNV